jgi:hypothetical protein
VKGKRWALTAIAVGLIYCNVAVIFNSRVHKQKIPDLPVSLPIYHSFMLFGVFSFYETNNHELSIWGLATDRVTQQAYWKELPTAEYFPFKAGEQQGRLWASMHYYNLDRAGHWAAWRELGDRILARYNRLHPDDLVGEVAFQNMTWPRSAAGIYARKGQGTKQYWVVGKAQEVGRLETGPGEGVK